MLRNAVGCQIFPEQKHYEGVRFNVIRITRGWMGVNFPGKKRYITVEWLVMRCTHGLTDDMCNDLGTDLAKKRRKIQAQGAANVRMMVSAAASLSSRMGTQSRMRTQETWKRNLAGALCCSNRNMKGNVILWRHLYINI